jgi:glycosyltransferase involved in cell wall biosynthesis
MPSILLAGPRFARKFGGLERALADLAAGLRELGFAVDDATGATTAPEARAGEAVPGGNWLTKFNRSEAAVAVWSRLSPKRRRALRDLFASRREMSAAAAALRELEHRLSSRRYDAVLYCVEEAPPGGLALTLARHRCVVVIAIEGLAAELAGGTIAGPLLRARGGHPWLGRRASARAIRCAIVSSRSWGAATVRAGVAASAVHPVYFGVPVPALTRPPIAFRGRLLYVGRLVKEKGAHLLLEGVALAREKDPRLTLTLVVGEGPRAYRSLVARRIAELGIADAVDWRPSLPRDSLPALEAMAAHLAVIAPSPLSPSPIYEDGVTCITFTRRDRAAIARAIERLSGDPALAEKVAVGGAERIGEMFTPAHTARQYAALITSAIATTR